MGRLSIEGIKHVSPTQLSLHRMCEQRWHGVYVGKEREPGTEATAMGAGFAAALEMGLDMGLAEYFQSRPVPDSFTDEEAYERLARVGELTIRHAVARYTDRFNEPTLEREVSFLTLLPLQGRHVPWAMQVRLDGLDLGQGYIVEDKLRAGASLQPEKIENEVRQGEQITAEVWSVWKKTGEILPVKLRCVRKPDQRKLKSTATEDLDAFIGEQFERENVIEEYECVRTSEQLQAFQRRLTDQTGRIEWLASPTGHGSPLRNTDACHSFGRACPFLGRCQGTEVSES